ncbi:nickel ABC transporter permease subunit NikB [Vallitalea sediminicola]
MSAYIRKRLIGLIFVLIGITFFSFVLANISPIDPAEAYMRRSTQNVTQEQIQRCREEMGYDLPIHKQYFRWVSNVIRGDFGESLATGNPVAMEISKRFPKTLMLVVVALIMIIIISIPIGIISANYKDSFFDHLIRVMTIFGISIPGFWLGFMLLYLFAVKLKLVSVVGNGEMKNIILPAITLAIGIIASNIRFLRANMLENMNMDYVVYAKARGISNRRIIWKHVFKNALPPLITLFGQTIGFMIAGTVIVESVFSWPGLGIFAINAIAARDLPFISIYVLLMAVIFVVCNLFADIINIFLNPQMLKKGGGL